MGIFLHRGLKLAAVILILSAVTPLPVAHAQYYTLGSDPSSVSWSKIKSANYSIVYPDSMDSLARVYLFNFEKNRNLVNEGMNLNMANVPLVLHPYSSLSNATVVWAPKRVDILTTPPFERGYADTWENQLALHEARHIGQMTHYTTGFFKFLNVLLGEQSAGLGVGFYPTGWFLEGDAVHTETDFTQTGRGRDPDFLMGIKASIMEGENRSYDNWRFGSYRYYAPNKYSLGYFLHSTAKYYSNNYHYPGQLMRAWAYEVYNLGIYNASFRRYTKNTARKHYRSGVQLFREYWSKDLEERGSMNPMQYLSNNPNNYYTSYHSPMPMAAGLTYAIKSGDEDASQLISIDSDGNERFVRPFASTSYVSQLKKSSDSTFIWSEIIPDLRWELKDNSIIREYNINSKKITNLTKGSKYFNPSLSEDGQYIAVTEYSMDARSLLVILNRDGQELAKVAVPKDGQLKQTVWKQGQIYAGIITADGWGLFSIDLKDIFEGASCEAWRTETPEQTRTLRDLGNYGEDILFLTDLDGVTNVYGFSTSSKQIYKLTNAPYGVFSPNYDSKSNSLFYTYYDHKGYHPVRSSADSLLRTPASINQPYKFYFADYFSEQANSFVQPLSAQRQTELKDSIALLPSQHFSRLSNAFQIHSWAPFYASINRILDLSYDYLYQLAAPGATILMQNLLGTAATQVGYSYHNGFHAGHLHFTYSGLYPAIELTADYNDRHKTILSVSEQGNILTSIDTTQTAAIDMSARIYLPINLGKSGWNSGLISEIQFNYSNDEVVLFDNVARKNMNLQYGVRYYRMLPQTKTNLMPRLGIGVELRGANAKGDLSNSGRMNYAYLYGYLPGITKQQGIKLSLQYQIQNGKKSVGYLPNMATVPRGYQSYILRDYAKLSVDYGVPIYLGDFQPTTLIYLMRLNLIPFFDYAIDNLCSPNRVNMYSYGTSALLQGHFFHIGAEIQIGVRWARYYDIPSNSWKNNFRLVTYYSL